MSERNDDRGTTDEQPPDDHPDALPVDRRGLLEGSLASTFGMGSIPAMADGVAAAPGDGGGVSRSADRGATTRESREFTVLLTNFESKWTDGWTSVAYFEADGDPYFFLLKESNGRVNVHSVKDHNGYFNGDIERHDWASGWTSVKFYRVGGQLYLFLLKEGDGEVHIHEMNDDGTVGSYEFKHNWASDWTSVEFYEVGGQTYLFLLKEDDGEVHIHEMKNNGNVGRMTDDTRTQSDWTSAEFYEVGGQTYLFLLKEGDGTAHVHEMNGGTLDSPKHTYDWDSGWTTVEFYEAGGDKYLFLLKEGDGKMHIHGMNDDGSVRPLKFYADWTSGWTDATFYRPDSGGRHHCKYWPEDTTYLSLLKESNGEGHLHEINEDGSVGRRLNPDEPEPPSYYEKLITEAGRGEGLVADYWRNVSHGNMDLKGSEVYGWITIPKSWEEVKSRSSYDGGYRWGQIQESRKAAEDAPGAPSSISNGKVVAVHNEPPESGAAGNNILAHPFATGVTFFTHEMGHCFDDNLPHSGSNLDFTPPSYDDPWDVMSAMGVCRSVYARDQPDGPIGPGLNAYNRDTQGWLESWQVDEIEPDDGRTAERTIKSLSKPFENNDETLVVRVNIPDDSTNDYHYFVELRTPHGFDWGMEEPVALIHRIVHNSGNNKPSRVLRRTPDETNQLDSDVPRSDIQGWSKRRPFSYVFDDDERIGITARSVQQTIQPEGGTADVYVGTKPGNVRLHQFDRERVGGEIGRHDWAEGWTSAEFYEVDGQQYLFLLKEGDGEVHIHEMNDDGTVGSYEFKHNWASGWSSVEFYEAGGQTFLFLLEEGGSSGRVHIHEMKNNGNVGRMTTDIPMPSGLTHAESYEVGGGTYMSLMDGNDGEFYAIEMTDFGTFGSIVDAEQNGTDWSNLEFYETAGGTYRALMQYNGSTTIHEMDSNGSIGSFVKNPALPLGAFNVEFYEYDGQTFLFRLNESDGSLDVRDVNDDGTFGTKRHTREWSSGWTTVTAYEVDDEPHLFLLKETGT